MNKQNFFLSLFFSLISFIVFESKAQFGNLLQKAKQKAALATNMLDGKKVIEVPQNFLIDPNRKIIAKNLSSEQLESTLAQLLN